MVLDVEAFGALLLLGELPEMERPWADEEQADEDEASSD
jgi:hypothetical protein